jgi:delta14-sterol reductase
LGPASLNGCSITGLSTLLLSFGLALGMLMVPGGAEGFTYLYDHWLGLLTGSVIMAVVQATWVYLWSFRSRELLALGGNSGVFIYDVSVIVPFSPPA